MTIVLSREVPSRRPHLLVLSMLVALGPLTIDLYLPAFPAVQADLDASPAAVQLTLTATTVGFALGQLIMGPLSDVVGRRGPLMLATALHVFASIGVALASDINWMLAFRLLQGTGAAGGAVVTMAIVRDLCSGQQFVLVMARLALISGLAPVLAPALGSQLLRPLDWRGLFVCVALYGAIALAVAAASLNETLPRQRRGGSDLGDVVERYRRVLEDRSFVGVALIGGMMVSGVFAYMTSSSFLLQRVYGLDMAGYSVVFAVNALAFVLGTQVAARVLGRVTPRTLLARSLSLLTAAGVSVALTDMLGLGLPALVACTVVFHMAAGATGPCVSMIGLAEHGARAGTAAAVLGATTFGLAGVLSPVVGVIGVDSAQPVGVVMGLVGIAAVILLVTLVRPSATQPPRKSTKRAEQQSQVAPPLTAMRRRS